MSNLIQFGAPSSVGDYVGNMAQFGVTGPAGHYLTEFAKGNGPKSDVLNRFLNAPKYQSPPVKGA